MESEKNQQQKRNTYGPSVSFFSFFFFFLRLCDNNARNRSLVQQASSNNMLQGKRALVVGVANARSIAWGIADRWRKEGAEVFVTYQVRCAACSDGRCERVCTYRQQSYASHKIPPPSKLFSPQQGKETRNKKHRRSWR